MIGCHIGKNAHGSFVNSIKVAYMMGANAIQFNYSPTTSALAGKIFKPAEILEINKLKEECGIYIVVHGKYLYNFCHNKPWQEKSLEEELRAVSQIGCDIVLHQGKNVPELGLTREQALENFVTNLSRVLENTESCTSGLHGKPSGLHGKPSGLHGKPSGLLLENSCQQGTELGYTIDELAKIYNMFDTKYHSRIGFCIDLCHIFVAGSLDLRTSTAVDMFFKEFDQKIGIESLKLIHYNDSFVPFNGHNDHHHDILVGFIGNSNLGGSNQGFKQVVKLATSHKIPMILETPGPSKDQPDGVLYTDAIALLRSWSENDDKYEEQYKAKYAGIINTMQTKKTKHTNTNICCKPDIAPASAPAKSKIIIKIKK